ncbi:hypothetical protein SeLEV6574_g06821 [Synchytrium endobioticum]|nr:hypothetical protein SeLEV6574_g06821 [Synchytrium endobioticum]
MIIEDTAEEYEEISKTLVRYYITYLGKEDTGLDRPALAVKVIHIIWSLLLFVWASLSLAFAFTGQGGVLQPLVFGILVSVLAFGILVIEIGWRPFWIVSLLQMLYYPHGYAFFWTFMSCMYIGRDAYHLTVGLILFIYAIIMWILYFVALGIKWNQERARAQ